MAGAVSVLPRAVNDRTQRPAPTAPWLGRHNPTGRPAEIRQPRHTIKPHEQRLQWGVLYTRSITFVRRAMPCHAMPCDAVPAHAGPIAPLRAHLSRKIIRLQDSCPSTSDTRHAARGQFRHGRVQCCPAVSEGLTYELPGNDHWAPRGDEIPASRFPHD